ncbi:uncharacterized protein B0P05DRAFT_580590 [Gilbertella persicaria]|uniref:uncharacterized protein n=1 Tax=Gilbertella persicaria TaxID=101096 RepID=UPI0022200842|nr:uncharacterized protein B0P05DRAFT_580590 [Gilbertella persicaria]KAI8069057.1 hypothetical protein B0P05DRAFT_580590 [Gilbertella persicaria]
MNQFQSWIETQGIITYGVQVKHTDYAGYGLFSKETIDATEPKTVVSIPSDLILTSSKALQVHTEFKDAVFEFYEETILSPENEHHVLCLFLVYCQYINQDTRWKPYFDILPTLSFFQDHHVLFNPACVQGTSLENATRAKLTSLKTQVQAWNTSNIHWLSRVQLDMYLWADCIFWSRVVGIGGDMSGLSKHQMAMIPYFDFANHSDQHANIRWQLVSTGLELVTSEEHIPQDQELFLSYGSKSNQELLFLHGFCVPDNSESSVITLPLLPFLDPAHDQYKIEWLIQMGVKPILKLSAIDQHNFAGWDEASVAVMYLVVLDQEDIEFKQGLLVRDTPILSLSDLKTTVESLELYPVIQLRAIVLLLDALEYQYTQNKQYQMTDESPVSKQASIYRHEEQVLLNQSMNALTVLRDQLMKNTTVISFLKANA